jgi:hypothetical protein
VQKGISTDGSVIVSVPRTHMPTCARLEINLCIMPGVLVPLLNLLVRAMLGIALDTISQNFLEILSVVISTWS